MFKVSIIGENEQIRKLGAELAEMGFTCSIVPSSEKTVEQVTEQATDLVLIAMLGPSATAGVKRLIHRIKQERHLPVIALLSKEAIGSFNAVLGIDDFVVEPWQVIEVAVRIKRILWPTTDIGDENLIKCGDLVIDLAKCEVSVSGKPIILTFKEYQLVKFLAGNRAQVFTREDLLNKVWGYDYYGGDRTVDVHIRRLRSKIEDRNHSFIETVRNIGYKFTEGKKGERTE